MPSPVDEATRLAACEYAVEHGTKAAGAKYGRAQGTIVTWMKQLGYRVAQRKRLELIKD